MNHPKPLSCRYSALFFDLDGTLADTAHDLADALNRTLTDEGREPLAFYKIRPFVSEGSYALIELGFGIGRNDPEMGRLRAKLLNHYAERICIQSRLFPGMEQLLCQLEDAGVRWGIVTNKPGYLTEPLVESLNLSNRACVVVSGDTTSQTKPHPLPLLYACEQTDTTPQQTLYIGDDPRDIRAGREAGMETVAVRWGYLGPNGNPDEWGATTVVESPDQLIQWLESPKEQACG